MEVQKTRLDLLESFQRVRALSLQICEPLEPEDYVIQSMPDVSPPKWHLAHTTWFFEHFLLSRFKKNFQLFDPQFNFLFNSYYKSIGDHLSRPSRGLLSRPGLPVILEYRARIDAEIYNFIESQELTSQIAETLVLGLNHEEQHQELLVTDIKNILCTNPTYPIYTKPTPIKTEHQPHSNPNQTHKWINFKSGTFSIGASHSEFSFDNERPRHEVLVNDFQLGSRLITNQEYIEFIESGAYTQSKHWLSLGWEFLLSEKWIAPLYWKWDQGQWIVSTLNGPELINPHEPVSHVSFFEADAFARWKGFRLPTEAEWETAAQTLPSTSWKKCNDLKCNNLKTGLLRPLPSTQTDGLQQIFGDTWEWTSSAYLPYPGFKALTGPEGEYNGKFMSNQMILRGGSCATPHDHIRPTYRNYFPPQSRWQFTGIRLAKDSCEN